MTEFLHKDETYRILGACFEVYKEMGAGFLEPVYQECLEIELARQGIPFAAQMEVELFYKGRRLKHTYRPDFVCYDKVIVEAKAVSALDDSHRAQAINYLRASGLRVALLVNFSHCPNLEHERFAL